VGKKPSLRRVAALALLFGRENEKEGGDEKSWAKYSEPDCGKGGFLGMRTIRFEAKTGPVRGREREL